MILAALKYKDYTWPHNPRTYAMDYEKRLVVHSYPYTNYNEIDDLGVVPREIRGEGEFIGPGAYEEFQKLANIFYKKGPGKLIHPKWVIQNAVFKELKVEEEPIPDYVRYNFLFIEDTSIKENIVIEKKEKNNINNLNSNNLNSTKKESFQKKQYIVKKNDTLSLIAKRNNIKLKDLIKNNPHIKNPNLIYPGQKVKL